jgi:hypothetical protein
MQKGKGIVKQRRVRTFTVQDYSGRALETRHLHLQQAGEHISAANNSFQSRKMNIWFGKGPPAHPAPLLHWLIQEMTGAKLQYKFFRPPGKCLSLKTSSTNSLSGFVLAITANNKLLTYRVMISLSTYGHEP